MKAVYKVAKYGFTERLSKPAGSLEMMLKNIQP
jgi:hypothetical protein